MLSLRNGTSVSPSTRPEVGRPNRLAFRIAGISYGITSNSTLRLKLDGEMAQFEIDSARCDIEISADWTEALEMPSGAPLFHSGGLWTAFQEASGTSLYLFNASINKQPFKYCWFNEDVTQARVAFHRGVFDPTLPHYPLQYPIDELLMINRLGRGDGAEIHSCGVVTGDGLGRLFVGHSGAGKSTASRLWMKQPGVRVLSDDRIILRPGNSRPTMHGTPWHGDAGLAEQGFAPLHKIYLLEQAPTNEIVPLAPARAAAEIFARTFVPHHVGPALANTLHFLEEVTKVVPVAILRCTADQRAIDEVLRAD